MEPAAQLPKAASHPRVESRSVAPEQARAQEGAGVRLSTNAMLLRLQRYAGNSAVVAALRHAPSTAKATRVGPNTQRTERDRLGPPPIPAAPRPFVASPSPLVVQTLPTVTAVVAPGAVGVSTSVTVTATAAGTAPLVWTLVGPPAAVLSNQCTCFGFKGS